MSDCLSVRGLDTSHAPRRRQAARRGPDHKHSNTLIYDGHMNSVGSGPTLQEPLGYPVSVSVSVAVGGEDAIASQGTSKRSLYVLNTNPNKSDRFFQVIVPKSISPPNALNPRDSYEDWSCEALPPPPYNSYKNGIHAYTAVGDDSIWVSKQCAGTYAFDTNRSSWAQLGEWELPFSGHAHYVPEHKLWFGFAVIPRAHKGGKPRVNPLCAWDLAGAGAASKPVAHEVFEEDVVMLPQEWIELNTNLVHVGPGLFCIARFFTHYGFMSFVETNIPEEYFAVLTGVEIVRCNNSHGGVRMVEHRSACYTFGGETASRFVV